jgi:hypothetical protein
VSCSHFGLMVRTAVRALKAHWIGPDEGEAHAVSVKLEIDRLLRLRAPTNEIVHRVAPTPENSDRVNNACDKRPNRSKYLGIRPTNSPRSVAPFQILRVLHPHNGQLGSVVRAGVSASTTCHPIRSHIARRRARSRCRRTHKPDLASVATYVASPGS